MRTSNDESKLSALCKDPKSQSLPQVSKGRVSENFVVSEGNGALFVGRVAPKAAERRHGRTDVNEESSCWQLCDEIMLHQQALTHTGPFMNQNEDVMQKCWHSKLLARPLYRERDTSQ